MFRRAIALMLLVGLSLSPCLAQRRSPSDPELARKIAKFSPTVLTADLRRLSVGDRKALTKIIAAAKLLDPLFLRQVWSGNEALKQRLERDRSPLGRQRLRLFTINDGPWDRLDDKKPFIPGVPEVKPLGANYYPEDMTREEFETWVATLTAADKQKATGFFWLIRRGADRKLMSVPYSQAYAEFLKPAAALLKEAAGLTTNESLKRYLTTRAEALLTDDYYESDVAWMELDAPIDLTFGPYETYEDELFSYKAAFEAYVTLRDDAETAKLARFGQYLQELENNLPIAARYRNQKLGAASPIRVVNLVFGSGEANSGVQTAAFNLPNDERVVKEKGSKRVMLKNVQEAKFQKTLIPISRVVLAPQQRAALSFESFFTHILAHELMHGLGPHNISTGGQPTTVRQQLKELSSPIEEAKADITGLWALQYLIDKGVVEKRLERSLYTTFLASMFRSVRFGLTGAHGKGVAVQFNYLSDEGAIVYDERTGTFRIDAAKIKPAVKKLAGEIMTLQAEGSYEKAKALLDTYGVVRLPMQRALDRLTNVPVDLEPIFRIN